MDKLRGTGRTTRQICDAKHGALFIWPYVNSLAYLKRLRDSLDRQDIEIVLLSQATSMSFGAGRE